MQRSHLLIVTILIVIFIPGSQAFCGATEEIDSVYAQLTTEVKIKALAEPILYPLLCGQTISDNYISSLCEYFAYKNKYRNVRYWYSKCSDDFYKCWILEKVSIIALRQGHQKIAQSYAEELLSIRIRQTSAFSSDQAEKLIYALLQLDRENLVLDYALSGDQLESKIQKLTTAVQCIQEHNLNNNYEIFIKQLLNLLTNEEFCWSFEMDKIAYSLATMKNYNRALDIINLIHPKFLQENSLSKIARMLIYDGRIEKGLEILKKLSKKPLIAKVKYSLMYHYFLGGKTSLASQLLTEIQSIVESDESNSIDILYVKTGLISALNKFNQPDRAKELAEQYDMISEYYHDLYKQYYDKHDLKKANYYYDLYLKNKDIKKDSTHSYIKDFIKLKRFSEIEQIANLLNAKPNEMLNPIFSIVSNLSKNKYYNEAFKIALINKQKVSFTKSLINIGLEIAKNGDDIPPEIIKQLNQIGNEKELNSYSVEILKAFL